MFEKVFGFCKAGCKREVVSKEEHDELVKNIDDGTKVVKQSEIAQYASSDKTKGTIDERLTKLGFKEGSITFNTSVFNATEIKLHRQGNYVIGEITGQFVANAKNGDLIFTLPTNFIPTKTITIGSLANKSGDTYSGTSSTVFCVKNNYNSNGKFNEFYLVMYDAPYGIKYYVHTLQFGFEVQAL